VESADDIKKFKLKIFEVLEEECLLAVRNIEELKFLSPSSFRIPVKLPL
jgi:hypothetical protein